MLDFDVEDLAVIRSTTFKMVPQTSINPKTTQLEYFFFFSFAYTTSPVAVMKLVVFFRSSKPPYNFW